MANCCYGTVVFYSNNNSRKLLELERDLARLSEEAWFGELFELNNIFMEQIYLRGNIIYKEVQEDYIKLDVEAAWKPLVEAYSMIAKCYELEYEYIAEEPSIDLYVNTDTYGYFFEDRYKVRLYNLESNPYVKVFGHELNEDIYYQSAQNILNDFEYYGYRAKTIEELKSILDSKYICIFTFKDR